MSVEVRYFASLREQMGRARERVEVAEGATVASLWRRVAGERALPANVLAAVNQEYAEPGQTLCDGDEVAFFPPVTGG